MGLALAFALAWMERLAGPGVAGPVPLVFGIRDGRADFGLDIILLFSLLCSFSFSIIFPRFDFFSLSCTLGGQGKHFVPLGSLNINIVI